MLNNRVIPCLLLHNGSLVKTINFKKKQYIGDPLNTCRIFNELEVDEMTILDIDATKMNNEPDFELLKTLANECFMPLSYGGGINNFEDAIKIFSIGYEKIVLNSILFRKPELITEISDITGNQSIIASVDIKKDIFGHYRVFSCGGKKKESVDLMEWIKFLEKLGIGEILLTNIDKEGTWKGFDLSIIKNVTSKVSVPVVVSGGAGNKKDVEDAINFAGASAVALGSMVVYQNKGMGVLINYTNNYNFK